MIMMCILLMAIVRNDKKDASKAPCNLWFFPLFIIKVFKFNLAQAGFGPGGFRGGVWFFAPAPLTREFIQNVT